MEKPDFEGDEKLAKSNLPTSISLWRKIVNRLMSILLIVALVLAVVPLIYILGDVIVRGAPAISLAFLTHLPTGPLLPGGGIANTIAGTFTMVGLAALISIPIGVGAGIFFSEWPNSQLSTVSSFMNDVLTGFPSMVIGLFVFIIVVLSTKHFSAFAGSVALSFIMIPIIARTNRRIAQAGAHPPQRGIDGSRSSQMENHLPRGCQHWQKRTHNRRCAGDCACNRGDGAVAVDGGDKLSLHN